MDTISEVTDRVKTAFDTAGIEIPFPLRDITIVTREKKRPVRISTIKSRISGKFGRLFDKSGNVW